MDNKILAIIHILINFAGKYIYTQNHLTNNCVLYSINTFCGSLLNSDPTAILVVN